MPAPSGMSVVAAVTTGRLDTVRETLAQPGCVLDATDDSGNTGLHVAAYKGLADIVDVLLAAGARTDLRNGAGNDALRRAIAAGHAGVAHRIWSSSKDPSFSNAHLLALGSEYIKEEVVLNPAACNAADACGFTPVHVAAYVGNAPALTRLLREGGDAEAKSASLWAALHAACSNGHDACVRVLLEARAKVDVVDKNGSSPLMLAAEKGHAPCVRALLDARPKLELARANGCTALHAACISGQEACVQLLQAAGANKEAVTADGCTPLYVACYNGREACARALLAAGANK
ncbi:ankyrin repeat domain-containing protein, partial [archaeon]